MDFVQEPAHSFSGDKNNLWAHPWFQHNEIQVDVKRLLDSATSVSILRKLKFNLQTNISLHTNL